MSWFTNTELNSMDVLFLDQIQDLYDAESRLVQQCPRKWRTQPTSHR